MSDSDAPDKSLELQNDEKFAKQKLSYWNTQTTINATASLKVKKSHKKPFSSLDILNRASDQSSFFSFNDFPNPLQAIFCDKQKNIQ